MHEINLASFISSTLYVGGTHEVLGLLSPGERKSHVVLDDDDPSVHGHGYTHGISKVAVSKGKQATASLSQDIALAASPSGVSQLSLLASYSPGSSRGPAAASHR